MDAAGMTTLNRPLIILLHGTYAGIPAEPPAPKRWWEEGSGFRAALESVCPGHETRAFPWGMGGGNSEILRRAGGKQLLAKLQELERQGRPYHLVGHSHGGSVIWQALAQSETWWRHANRNDPRSRPLQHLRSWTTVGTPFQDFAPANVETIGSIVLLLVALAAILVLGAFLWPLHNSLELNGVLRHAHDWSAPPWSPIDEPVDPSSLTSTGYWLAHLATAALSASTLAALGVALLGLLLKPILESAADTLARRRRIVLATVAFAIPWAFLTWSVVDRVGGRLGLALVALGLLGTVLATALLSVAAVRVLANWPSTLHFRRLESLAARHYGPLWREIHHPYDEAIAALRCALLEAPRIVPRPPPSQLNPIGSVIAFSVEPLKRIADQFAWRAAMSRVQGNDLLGADVQASGIAPRALVSRLPQANRLLGDSVAQSADEEGRRLLGDIRLWLAQAYLSRQMDEAVRRLTEKLTFGAAIHTSYFTEIDPAGDEQRPREEVLSLVAAHITGSDSPLPPRPETAVDLPVVEAYGLHRRLSLLRMAGAVVAVMLMTALYGLGHTLVVTPLQRATQIDAIKGLPKRPGALATSDSPVVAAFLVRLAADPAKFDMVEALKRVTEPNVRAVAGQRLAFAYGMSGDADGFAPLAAEVTKWPENWKNPGYSERTSHLLFLSRLAGAASAGRGVSAEEARTALEAWRVLPCEETDRDAAAALAAIALAGAGDVEGVGTVSREAAERRDGRCAGVAESQEERAAWMRSFLVDRAEDVLSWDRKETPADSEPSLRRRAAALTLMRAAPFGGRPVVDVLAGDAQLDARGCTAMLERYASELDTGEPGACGDARRAAAGTVRGDLLGAPALAAIASGRLDQILARTRPSCRSESLASLRKLEGAAEDALAACTRSVEASRRIVAAAAVLFATGDPTAGQAALVTAGPASFWDTLGNAVEPLWRDMRKTLATMGDGALWPILDVHSRGGASDAAGRERLAAVVGHIVDAQAELAGCQPSAADPCKEGPFALDHIWTTVDMFLVAGRRSDAQVLVRNAMAGHSVGPCPPPDPPANLLEPASLLRLAFAADRAQSKWITTAILEHIACPSSKPQPCPVYLGLLSTDESVTYAKLAEGRQDLIELAHNCLKHKIARENSGAERARQIQQLASIYMFDDDLYASREAAERAGAVNFVIAGLCPVLDRERARGPRQRDPGHPDLAQSLQPISRWPQPAPVYFGDRSRFTYENERPGPLSCQGRRTYDLT